MLVFPLAGQTLAPPGGAFASAEWTDEGGPPGPPRPVAPPHVHHAENEARYVLKGTLAFRLGDREIDAPAGSAVFAARGTPHTFWNPGSGPARYLIVMMPNTLRLVEALHALRERNPEAVRAIFRQHDSELLG